MHREKYTPIFLRNYMPVQIRGVQVRPPENPWRHINRKELVSSLLFIGTGLLNPFPHPSYQYLAFAIGSSAMATSLTPMNEVIARKARQTLRNLQFTLMGFACSMIGVAYYQITPTINIVH
jgi:hypothetical protein